MGLAPFPPDVGVAIVCHNNRDKLASTLASLDAAGCPRSAIRVVDVLSTDGTVEWLRHGFPDIGVEALDRNDGQGPGRNLGIRSCPFPYVFLMDADVLVQPETIQRLRTAMTADPNIKIGSPIVVHVNAPDTIQYADVSLHFMCEAINPWMDLPLADAKKPTDFRGTYRPIKVKHGDELQVCFLKIPFFPGLQPQRMRGTRQEEPNTPGIFTISGMVYEASGVGPCPAV